MNYTCPKCGKKMDLSTEVLISSEYKVICPQCLSTLQIVGDYAYIPNDAIDLDTTVEPSRVVACPRCGREASSGNHFCPNCGASFDEAFSTPAVDEVVAEDVAENVTVMPPPLPDTDPLYQDALSFLASCMSITPMMLRDHFRISDERAANLIRQLEQGGAIGPYNNGGPRQILIPHRGLYDLPQAATGNAVGDTPRPGGRPRPRRMGCVSWLMIIFLFSLLIKACGG